METLKKHKFAILGDTNVGKTSITTRFVNDKFDDYTTSTIGAAFKFKKLFINNQLLILDIWDTAGQERYRSLAPLYYKNSSAIIIVYDITSIDTFNMAKFWADEVKDQENTVIAFVGNKSDQLSYRKIDFEEARDFANTNNFIYKEVSAKTGDGIQELFNTIGEKLLSLLPISQQPNIFIEKKKYNFWCF